MDELSFGNTVLDLDSATLICGNNSIRLSAKEFDIMRFLLQSGEKNLSKEAILARVWGYDSDAVENHVGGLHRFFCAGSSPVLVPTSALKPSGVWATIWKRRTLKGIA